MSSLPWNHKALDSYLSFPLEDIAIIIISVPWLSFVDNQPFLFSRGAR